MSLFKLNPIKKKLVYHYSKIVPYGKMLKINIDNGLKYVFRGGSMDKNVIKEVWAKNIYTKYDFDIREKDVLVDIGAHIGVFSVMAASKAIKGKVFAFEPMTDNYEILMSNIKLNSLTNIISENVAVSKENGSRTFYLSSHKTGSNVGYNTGGHSLFPDKKRDEKIKVKTLSFDHLLKKYNIDKIDYLKIDTEGAEYEILLNSSKQTIQKINKIVMELHPFNENTKDKMITFLEENGFNNTIDTYGDDLFMVYSKR